MKKVLLVFLSLISFFSFSIVVALDAPKEVIIEKTADTFLKINWENIEGASGYYIYYSKESGIDGGYSFEGPDLLEESFYRLENLDPETTYYVAITSVDENGDESIYSEEQVTTTLESGDNGDGYFGLENIELLSFDRIKLLFNSDLDNSEGAIREFRIIDKSNGKELSIDKLELEEDHSNIVLTLSPDMESDNQYELTIIAIEDIDGRNIESGIKGIVNFTIPKNFDENNGTIENIFSTTEGENIDEGDTPKDDLNSAGTEEDIDEGDTPEDDLNSAGISNDIYTGNAGENINIKDIKKTTETVANDTKELTKTGPESIILLLLAMLIGGVLFGLLNRKSKI